MKEKKRTLLAIVLLIAGLLVVLMRLLPKPEQPEAPRAERWVGMSVESAAQPPAPTVPGGANGSQARLAHSLPPPLPQWAAEQGLEGEFWVRVNSTQEAQALRQFAQERGLRILGSIDALGAFRLAGRPVDWRSLPLEDWQGGANTAVFLPNLPDAERIQATGLPGVGRRLASSVGLEQLDPDWGRGVLVAVLDTGIQAAELSGLRVVQQLDLVQDGEPWMAHATAVAHLLGGEGAFATGLARSVDILDIRVLNSAGSGDAFTLAAGIIAAVEGGADIINISLGGYQHSGILAEAVRFAQERGVLLIAAAGNDGSGRPLFPAAFPEVMAVAAHDAARQNAPFSNHGAHIELSAPGVGLYTLWDAETWVAFDGTSAAAPLVSAAAATLLSLEPHLSPSEVRNLLAEFSADAGRPGQDPFFGAGTLDLGRLIHRQQAGWHDVAIADVFTETQGGQPALLLSVQNLGTEMALNSTLQVSVNNHVFMPLNIAAMRPGEVAVVQVPIDLGQLPAEGGWQIEAQVNLPTHLQDQRETNNSIRATVRPAP